MSSGNPGGAPNLALKPKRAPSYPPGAIKSERDADFTGAGPTSPTGIKLGIRVKMGQTPTLTLTTRATPGHPGTVIPLTGPLPQTDPIVADLKNGLGCDSDEQWFAYTLNWNPALKLKFDSTLNVTPFPFPPFVTDNGFEIVTVAFCHASQNFTSGVYTYAVSVLPGKNSTGLPMSLPQASSGKKSTKKSAKKPKAKAKSKKKYRR
jgi:hypothetical protein